MRIAITGSNGFIGSELVKYFLAKGDEVLLLQRRKPYVLVTGMFYQEYDLNRPDMVLQLDGVEALIHTAYIPYTSANNASALNVEGAIKLYKLCLAKGVQFIFLSTMSAHANALSEYGKHKFQLEQTFDSTKCLILKLGLVIGNDGLFSRMYNSFKKMPFAVLVGGGAQPVQPIYVGDVVNVIAKSIAEKRTGKYTFATNRVYTMKELFTAIAGKAGKKPLFISVPYSMVNVGIGMVALLHLPLPVSKENLLGLKQLQAADTAMDLAKLEISPLDLKASIDRL